ncbi:MAG: pyruvoyl-dependent arginine decarboxylase [Candidatus Geothermarchaeales archaeon]
MHKPKGFFITGGVGISSTSSLNAFDNALKDAGLSDYNLIPVSSIIPGNAEEIEPLGFEKGSIVFVVMGRCHGNQGDDLTAGIAWAKAKDGSVGMVMEYDGRGVNAEAARVELERRVKEAFAVRGLEAGEVSHHLEMLRVPEGSHGCAVACLVFTL